MKLFSKYLALICVILTVSASPLLAEGKQAKDFSFVKIVLVRIHQNYGEAKKVELPLLETVKELFAYSDIEVISDNSEKYDAVLAVDVSGAPLKNEYKGDYSSILYSGASVKGKVILNISGETKLQKKFAGTVSPPFSLSVLDIEEYASKTKFPDGAPFEEALELNGSFVPVMVSMLYDLRGINPIIAAATSKKPGIRTPACEIIMSKKYNRKSFESLAEALKDNNTYIRYLAIEALGKLKDKRTLKLLLPLLYDQSDDNLRNKIIKVFGILKDQEAIEPLISILRQEFNWEAVYSLEAIGKPAIQPLQAALANALNEKNDTFINGLVTALGCLKAKSAIEVILRALKYGEEVQANNVIYPASDALENITGQSIGISFEKWDEWWKKNKAKFNKK